MRAIAVEREGGGLTEERGAEWAGAAGDGRAPAAEARFSAAGDAAAGELAHTLQRQLVRLPRDKRQRVVLLCIGSDRSTGDALGPIVGTLLRDAGWGEAARAPGGVFRHCGVLGVAVRGTLDQPVHAANLAQTLREVACPDDAATVVAVDACLGRAENVGTIAVGLGPLRPGAGVNKELPAVGDMYVTGTVNVAGFMEYVVLQNTRLSLVMGMAQAVAGGVLMALGGVGGHRLHGAGPLPYPAASWRRPALPLQDSAGPARRRTSLTTSSASNPAAHITGAKVSASCSPMKSMSPPVVTTASTQPRSRSSRPTTA